MFFIYLYLIVERILFTTLYIKKQNKNILTFEYKFAESITNVLEDTSP